jgi:hypothetical protein
MPSQDFPSRCPGCKQHFRKRRQWEKHHCHLLDGLPDSEAEDLAEDGQEELEEACVA